MQLRYLTLCDEWGSWSKPILEYTNDDEANPYEVGLHDGWEEVPFVRAKYKDRQEDT